MVKNTAMLFSLRTKKKFRQFYLLLALHLLNISVDPPDIRMLQVREEATINEMESIGEWVFETLLCHDNCVPETDEQENSEHLQSLSSLHIFILPAKSYPALHKFTHRDRTLLPNNPNLLTPQYSPGIFSPPPEVI
jgi:hypothetical protein